MRRIQILSIVAVIFVVGIVCFYSFETEIELQNLLACLSLSCLSQIQVKPSIISIECWKKMIFSKREQRVTKECTMSHSFPSDHIRWAYLSPKYDGSLSTLSRCVGSFLEA